MVYVTNYNNILVINQKNSNFAKFIYYLLKLF